MIDSVHFCTGSSGSGVGGEEGEFLEGSQGQGKGVRGRGRLACLALYGVRSRSSKAGLQFPVGRVHRHLRVGRYAARVHRGRATFGHLPSLAGAFPHWGGRLLGLSLVVDQLWDASLPRAPRSLSHHLTASPPHRLTASPLRREAGAEGRGEPGGAPHRRPRGPLSWPHLPCAESTCRSATRLRDEDWGGGASRAGCAGGGWTPTRVRRVDLTPRCATE